MCTGFSSTSNSRAKILYSITCATEGRIGIGGRRRPVSVEATMLRAYLALIVQDFFGKAVQLWKTAATSYRYVVAAGQ